MSDFLEHMREIEVDESTKSSIIAKCQENEWVRKGGYAWQDDPYLEDYPYGVLATESLEDLREYFHHGNWAIRQCVIYKELAFVQQDDGGDEWWTLRRTADSGSAKDWFAFESWSFRYITQDPHEFSDAITGMLAASLYELQHLEYSLPRLDEPWVRTVAQATSWSGDEVECQSLKSRFGDYEIKTYERPSFEGAMLEIFNTEEKCIVFSNAIADTVTKAAKDASDMASLMKEKGVLSPEQWKDVLRGTDKVDLANLASGVRAAAEAINSGQAFPIRTERQRS